MDLIYRYKIVNDEILEETYFNVDYYKEENAKPLATSNTGIKAFYTKKEIMQRYKWGGTLMRKFLLEIGDKIYQRNKDGKLITTKKKFSPSEMEIILNHFGTP